MHVDRGRFLLFVSSLAAGGAGGYFLSEMDVVPHLARGTRATKPVSMLQEPAPAPTATPAALPVAQTELTSAKTTLASDDPSAPSAPSAKAHCQDKGIAGCAAVAKP